jgi:hypothetical protein
MNIIFKLLITAGIFIACTGLFRCGDELQALIVESRLEQLRSDYAVLNDNKALEDVLGQITEINQKIASKEELKNMPYIELGISEKWSLMKKITLKP